VADKAYRNNFGVTIQIGHLNVPPASRRNAGDPGVSKVQRLINVLNAESQLIDPSHRPAISNDGTTLSFKIHPATYAPFKEADIKRIYRRVTGRELTFVASPQGSTSRSASGRSNKGGKNWVGDFFKGLAD
jgi:hypothetical protein